MIKPDLKMNTIYVIYTYLHTILKIMLSFPGRNNCCLKSISEVAVISRGKKI